MPPKENPVRACEECIHFFACFRQCGEPMAQSSATGCECYETVKSSMAYFAGTLDGAKGEIPNRLRELAEADKDGRVIILPYKVGDTVYYIGGGGFGDIVVEGTVTDIRGLPDRAVKVRPAGMGFSIGLDADHLFRTYAAAQKSIGGK